jgi:hypothetical protein
MSDQEQGFDLLDEEDLCARFIAASENPDDADNFFNRLGYIGKLLADKPHAAIEEGLSILSLFHRTDPTAYERIHKGTPFYWLCIAAFMAHNYELATSFCDAAVSEDLRKGANPINKTTPPLLFLQLDGSVPFQAAKPLVELMEKSVGQLLYDYNSRPCRTESSPNLYLQDLRSRFLTPAVTSGGEKWRSLATAFISFALERHICDNLLEVILIKGSSETIFLHLFKGCLLFESLLKCNPVFIPKGKTLGDILINHCEELHISNNLKIVGPELSDVLSDLSKANSSIETAIRFTGRLRNTLGHNLGWPDKIDKEQYNVLLKMISSSCLYIIALLYR